MITIIDVAERKNSAGETFTALILAGSVEMIKSMTGRFYATTRKASVPSTLSLAHAKSLIGTKMPGSIIKVPCEPYVYTTKSGDQITLDFSYSYSEQTSTEEALFH
jgi:hypothetical protein